MTSSHVDNELDMRGLCCKLWRGKHWIIGCAVLLMLLAYVYSLLVRQAWSTTAITDRPTVNMLGSYYSQQQFLHYLDMRNAPVSVTAPLPTAMDEAYQEFLMQLASWDTRRDFWQQTDYYRQRKSGNTHNDAALLDELISHIELAPADAARNPHDSVRLTAETAADANNLLRQYVAFASERAARHLNDELDGAWQVRAGQLQAQIARQESVANTVYQRQLRSVTQALKIASEQGINETKTTTPSEQLPDSELFMLGRPLLQARLESLQVNGPAYDSDYDQNRAMLTTLQAGPHPDKQFQSYRYLRTPEEPVKRDSPRRLFLMIMWGAVGALIGAGVALFRRPRHAIQPLN